jgi:iron complex outermembrane receptor protein
MMNKTLLLALLLATPEIASAATAPLDSTATGKTVYTAGEITVTGKKRNRNESITGGDMETLSKKNITQAVNVLPGIIKGSVGARNEGMIFVRGFDMRQVPLYLDGIPLYVPFDGYIDPNRFTTFDLSEITVSKGYTSVLFGPNTFGGAINMVSRKPEKQLEGTLRGGIATGNERIASKYASLNIGSNQGSWYAQSTLSTINSSFWPLSGSFTKTKYEDGGARDNSATSDFKGSVKVGYTPNSNDEYAITIDAQHAVKGIPVYTGSNPAQPVRFWKFSDWDKSSIYMIGRKALGEKSYLKTRTYFDNYYNALKSYDDATYTTQKTGKAFSSRYDDKTFGGSIESGAEIFRGNTLKAALHDKYDMHNEIGNVGELPKEYEDNTISLALENTWTASKKFSVIAGLREDIRKTKKAEDLVNKVITSFPLEDNRAANYQLAAVGRLDEHQEITTYVARTTRLPTLKDRYSYKLGNAQPNPWLKPEQSWNYGLDYSIKPLDHLKIQASLYQSKLSDVIQQVDNVAYINNKWVYQSRNTGNATYTGLECSADWQAASWLKTFTAYSYINRKNDTNPALHFTDVPHHKFTGYLQFFLNRKTWAMLETEYNSERYSTSDGKFKARAYGLLNLRINAALNQSLSLQAAVENIFDRNYEIMEGYPESGRSGVLSMACTF